MVRWLRITSLNLLAILFLVFLYIQFQQRLLRYRAEQLNEDVAYLRDHPGTWEDLQRIQKRWGAFAQYDGTCDQRHCGYSIVLNNVCFRLARHLDMSAWIFRPCAALGGNPTLVSALLRLTDNRIWRADITAATGAGRPSTPGYLSGRFESKFVIALIYFSPRLFAGQEKFNIADAQNGYRITPAQCPDCFVISVTLTPDASISVRDRLTALNFSCITRFHPCESASEFLPSAAEQKVADTKSLQPATASKDTLGDPHCTIPLRMRATEAENILVVDTSTSSQLLDVDHQTVLANSSNIHSGEPVGYLTQAKVVVVLKNGHAFRPGTTVRLQQPEANLMPPRPLNSLARPPIASGRYFVLFPDPSMIIYDPAATTPQPPELGECSVIAATMSARQEIAQGIADDPSVGERDNSYR